MQSSPLIPQNSAECLRTNTRRYLRYAEPHPVPPLKGHQKPRAASVSYRASVPAGHGGHGVSPSYRALSTYGETLPFGTKGSPSASPTPTDHCSLITVHWSYTFSAKEKDVETGLSYFGARYYSSDLSIWLSVDPMSDKYPSLSPYVYCADNPIKLVDPNGEAFVGVDGENVDVNQDKSGKISVGDNASEDLKRMASMINNSGSKTAAKQFMKLAKNECKIHFQIDKGKGDGRRIGYHQAHDEQGNPLDWVGDGDNGYFDGIPAIYKGGYKEATITLFEGLIDGDDGYKNKTPFDSDLSVDNAMVGVFAHEAEHNLNHFDIRAIKARSAGYTDNVRNVERAAKRVERKVYKEMYRSR